MAKFAGLNKAIFKLSNFNLEVLVDFPDKVRENETPLVVLKNHRVSEFVDI